MAYQLNHKAFERLKALVRAGKYIDRAWSFSAKDSNALLGDPPNWTDYGDWFLGIDNAASKESKAKYAYPYGKAGTVNLAALRAIVSRARQQGASDIADAAAGVLAEAQQQQSDKVAASSSDLLPTFDLLGEAKIEGSLDDSGKPTGPPTFTMLAYTGGLLKLKEQKYPFVVDLEGVSGHEKARPALRGHDQSKPVGHMPAGGISVTTGPQGAIRAEGVISGFGPHVDEVVVSGLRGFPWQSSIGAKVLENQFVPRGRSAVANGKTFQGPVNIARRTSLCEISFVTLGADDNTSARIAAEAAEGSLMTLEQWLEAMGLKLADLSADQKTKLQAKFDKEQLDIQAAADAKCEDDDDDVDADDDDDDDDDEPEEKPKAKAKAKKSVKGKMKAKKAEASTADLDITADMDPAKHIKALRAEHAKETKRIAKVREICAGQHSDIEAKAIDEGWDETKTELAVLRAARPSAGNAINASFGINTGAGAQITPEVITASAALAGGISEKAALSGLTDQQKQIATSRKLRSSVGSVYGLCATICAAHGMRMPASRMEPEVLATMGRIERRVADLDIAADGGGTGFSTMSLSGITENILNKAMLEAYGTVDSVVQDICYETDTNDFKQYKRYRLTASGILSALGASGELKSISLQDESYPNQVKTQGVILTIGRDLLINDDLGAITQAPTLLGRGSALYREMMVFATFLNLASTVAPGASVGQSANAFNFFSSGAGNLLSGGASVLQISSLTTAVQKFREQTDANNMPIMLKPDRLLVAPASEVTADNLFNGANLVVGALGSTSSKSVEPNLNAHKGKYRPIVSPFLSASVGAKIKTLKGDPAFANFANASDTAWTLLTNPSGGFATIQIGYLRGQRVPIIERGETNFNTLGMAMRCYYDFGVAPHDYRCGVQSAGA